jgi:hypothetical protein
MWVEASPWREGQKKIRVLLAGVFNSGILASGPTSSATYDYKTPLQELTRPRKFQPAALASLWKSSGKSDLRKRMAGHMALMPQAVTR